ncbi:MAG: hypothetical protein ACXVXB_16545 [Nocardioidaceae bacterium]
MGTEASTPGSTYQTWWAVLATAVGTLGVLLACVARPTDQVLALAATGLALGGCAGSLYDLPQDKITVRSMLVFGAFTGVGLVATLGVCAVLGSAGALLPLLLVVSSPWCIRTAHRGAAYAVQKLAARDATDSAPPPSAPAPVPAPPAQRPAVSAAPEPPVQDMDEAALLRAWRASSVAMARTGTREGRLRLAQRRQDYLDELEKRDPERFAAWLATRPRVDDDPTAFFNAS